MAPRTITAIIIGEQLLSSSSSIFWSSTLLETHFNQNGRHSFSGHSYQAEKLPRTFIGANYTAVLFLIGHLCSSISHSS